MSRHHCHQTKQVTTELQITENYWENDEKKEAKKSKRKRWRAVIEHTHTQARSLEWQTREEEKEKARKEEGGNVNGTSVHELARHKTNWNVWFRYWIYCLAQWVSELVSEWVSRQCHCPATTTADQSMCVCVCVCVFII